MIIAVDFDGTISRGEYPAIAGEQPYAGEVLRRLHEQGHYIIIWTCRTGERLLEAVNWLLERRIPFDRVNEHNPENIAQYGPGGRKVYAHCYIDDKNIGGFPGWIACQKEIERMETEYKTSRCHAL
ncbi:hypothetical protein ABLT32_06130 [Bacteroides pyogenes]|uniref:hypothetical protein n=1 Tax=Bacteroides pyogenes TaxID=310300 RepID=UPI001BAC3A72|nr:hypothetical protein [Bacteroides pyogenes]